MRGFTIQNRVFYEWKQKNLGWAPSRDATTTIDHFTYYCLGSQGGKLWVAMRLLGPIACRIVCRNTGRDHGKRPVCRSESSASSFNFFSKPLVLTLPPPRPSLGSERSIVLPLELNVRVRSRRRSSLPSQTLVLPLQLPSRKARQVRQKLAEAGKQIEEHKKREEEIERLPASSNVGMPAQKLRSRILSFENVKGNGD